MTRAAFLTFTALLLASSAHAADDYVLLQLRATAAGHALVDAKRIQVPQLPGAGLNASSGPLIDWQLQDRQGRTLSAGTVSDPRLLRAPLEPGRGHEMVWLPEAVYVLRLPVNAAATDLRLRARTNPTSGPRIQEAKEPATTTLKVGALMQPATPPR
jgi:hypothetical protein